MRMLKKYKEEGVNIDDPEEQPFHEDLSNLRVIMAGMVKRTQKNVNCFSINSIDDIKKLKDEL